MSEHHFSTFMLSHCCILFATQLIRDYWYLFWLKEVAALLIFDDLRSEGNRSLFKTENIINLSKDLDVHNGHRSSAANFIKCTDGRFTEKFLCSLKLMSSRRSILESFMQCWLNITESCSFVLETCKFVKTFISLSLMSPFMYRSNRSFNMPPLGNPPGINLTVLKIIVQITPYPGPKYRSNAPH